MELDNLPEIERQLKKIIEVLQQAPPDTDILEAVKKAGLDIQYVTPRLLVKDPKDLEPERYKNLQKLDQIRISIEKMMERKLGS